jgi:DHA1 family multidrug resistance protein-like MFS transporter
MFSGMGYSILSPLFPSLGNEEGFTETLIGWVISIFAFSSTTITPFTPLLCKKFTRIKLLYFATFCEATCTLTYGILSYIKSFYALLICMLLIRILHGCCNGIIGTLVYSLTQALAKPSEVTVALGNLEIGWCIGISSGPIFASIFYKIGDYPLPFIALGLFLYISMILVTKVANEKTESEEEIKSDPPFFEFLTYGEIVVILGALVSGMISESFFYPCLTLHLKGYFGLSVSISSLFFIVIAISYMVLLHFLEHSTQRFGLYATSFFGLLMASFGVLMIYPYPPIPKKIFFVILGFVLIGGGGAPIFIPGLVALTKIIRKIKPNIDELMANDISSAINNFTFAIGDCCGPIIGGFLSTHFGFKHCCLFVSLIILSYSILFFTYFRNYIYSDIKKIGMEELVDDTNNKTDEKELINHPGLYKGDNINNNNIEIEEKGEELKKHLDEAEYLKFDDDKK